MDTTLVIFRQTIMMFLYMAVGWGMYKKGLITEEGNKSMAHLLLYVILPCVIIKSFCLERTADNTETILWSFAGAAAVLLVSIAVSYVLFRKRPIDNFGASFSNAGFMGIPLITAALGEKAVVYTAGMIAILNALQWTYGQMVLSGDRKPILLKEVGKSPVVVALAAGLCIFLLRIPIPPVLTGSMGAIAQLNAPIAMIILGVYFANIELKEILYDRNAWQCSVIRLALIPVVTIFILKRMFGDSPELGQTLLISAAAPVGSNVAVYAQKLKQDYGYAVKIVCLSTLLSMVSMPVVMHLYNFI